MINISIADDFEVYRDGLKVGLSPDPNLAVISEADNGEQLMQLLESAIPDVIIMDIKMPVMDGMEATKQVRKKYPNVKVLVVSMYGDDKFLIHLMQNGANGYLLKNVEPEELRRAVYAVYENGYYFDDSIDLTLLRKILQENQISPKFRENIELTAEEKNYLESISEGTRSTSNSESNANCELLETLLNKTGVRNRAGLLMYAITQGMTG